MALGTLLSIALECQKNGSAPFLASPLFRILLLLTGFFVTVVAGSNDGFGHTTEQSQVKPLSVTMYITSRCSH